MANDFPEEGEFVLCTVTKITGTTVFVIIDNYRKEGVISTSEVAPGRIRNIRDYVTINKKIACKVLRISRERGNIDLSLRRVSQKDARAVMEEYNKEKSAELIIKIVLKDKALPVISKIKENYPSIDGFFGKLRENNALINDFVSKDGAEKILSLLKERIKEKKFMHKAILTISSNASNGLIAIKNALLAAKDTKIAYLGAPHYSIIAESNNPKDAEKKLKEAVAVITEKIKASGAKIECKEE